MMVRRATLNWRDRAEMFGRSRDLPICSRILFCRLKRSARAAEQFEGVGAMRAFEALRIAGPLLVRRIL